jgi:hypothetical protein
MDFVSYLNSWFKVGNEMCRIMKKEMRRFEKDFRNDGTSPSR